MTAALFTRDERIANVQRLGYAAREAGFLWLVALHGGYFVRRRCDVWIGVERSKRSDDFLADLLDRGHCRRYFFAPNRQVFHLQFTRPSANDLACYDIDSGVETGSPFATHLRDYLPLFAELPSFELVCVATASTRLRQAHTIFEQLSSRGRGWLTKLADPNRLLAHFRDRKLFGKRETSDFDRLRLDALRDDMHCFSGRHFAQMFTRWQFFGDEAIRAEIAAQKMPNGRFSSCILPHDYDLFGRIEATS